MDEEITEKLRYVRIPFSCSEAKSADGFELKEGMIVHWNFPSSKQIASGSVACSYAVEDVLDGPRVVIFDGEMVFMGSPSELFVTKSGLYESLERNVESDLADEMRRAARYRQLAEDNQGLGPVFSGPIIDWQTISDTVQ